MNQKSRFIQVFTVLAIVAAGGVFFFPLWGMSMDAPQYPQTNISVRVHPVPVSTPGSDESSNENRIPHSRLQTGLKNRKEAKNHKQKITPPGYLEGNLKEIQHLNQYIGVTLPRNIPEILLVKWILGLILLLLVLSLLHNRKTVRKLLLGTSSFLYVLLTAGGLGILQYRLYVMGHDRPEQTPLKGIEDFTPPALGWTKVGNFDVTMYPGIGGWLLFLSFLFAGLTLYFSLTERTPSKNSSSSKSTPNMNSTSS